MVVIRNLREEDMEDVRVIEAAAFGGWLRQLNPQLPELSPRTRTNLLALLDKDPEGCFVAQTQKRLVGFIFSRTWGSEGWFGTFGVLPEYHGQDIGKQLIGASLSYLQDPSYPGRTIGLETMPESPYNLGFYTRLGFQARFPTFLMSKSLEGPGPKGRGLSKWSLADAKSQKDWIADLQEATDRIRPGLDYSKEILSTAKIGLGETFVLTHGSRAIGMSVVWFQNAREGAAEEQASVQMMVLHPSHTTDETFRGLLDATEAEALARNKRKLTVPINTSHPWVLDQLIHRNYRVQQMRVRMVLEGTGGMPTTDRHVNCSHWLG